MKLFDPDYRLHKRGGLYAEFSLVNVDDSGYTSYYGCLSDEESWVIIKEEGGSLTYACGDSDYSTSWASRASGVVFVEFDELLETML